MPKAVFDKLTKDQQKAILEAAAETRHQNWAAIPSRLKETYSQLAAQNVKVITSDDDTYRAELQSAGDAALNQWLKITGPRGQALIDSFNAAKVN